MRKRIYPDKKKQKLNNKGSALVSVIVVVAFITVIATIMLYITGMNYQMKQTDYMNKKSFYKAEEALDELKESLVEHDMSDALAYAYQEASVQYANLEADARQAAFNGAFLDYLEDSWTVKKTGYETQGKTLNEEFKARVPAYEKCFIYDPADGEPVTIVNDRDNGRFIIKNIRVRYVENGYSTYISTDIGLCVPDLDMTNNSSDNDTWTKPDPTAGPERQTVVLSDYIIYMNWKKY